MLAAKNSVLLYLADVLGVPAWNCPRDGAWNQRNSAGRAHPLIACHIFSQLIQPSTSAACCLPIVMQKEKRSLPCWLQASQIVKGHPHSLPKDGPSDNQAAHWCPVHHGRDSALPHYYFPSLQPHPLSVAPVLPLFFPLFLSPCLPALLPPMQVVNLDDPNADYFISQAHPDVPLISYSLEDDRADVYALEVTLSLFETELLVRTPRVRP